MKTATDVGLQTWEADVTCGVWCQGGSVRWLKTDHPQYTDASDVWVRGDDAIAALESLRAELAELRRFRKVIMDYDSNLYDALANSDAARKGEGDGA